MLNINTLNAAINRALNALRSKRVKANQDARKALRDALSCLNEARLLLNQGDATTAYWMAQSADVSIRIARMALR